jgi:hypothetical protein
MPAPARQIVRIWFTTHAFAAAASLAPRASSSDYIGAASRRTSETTSVFAALAAQDSARLIKAGQVSSQAETAVLHPQIQ